MTDYPRIDSSDIKIGMIVERRERFEVTYELEPDDYYSN